MTFTKPDRGYWERKFIAYMHDPFDKVFRIQGHGERAAQFLDKYGLQKPNEDFWKKADMISAGFERGQVPSYSADPNRNGAVDFLENPTITHPTSKKAHLKITIPNADGEKAREIHQELLEFVEKEIGMKPGQGGYSDQFEGKEDQFAVARFLYTHLALRFKLAESNVGGLGGFWHRVPADSRFPDHSIWQHNALCSALCSSIERSGDVSEVGMMVFSITPVQPFIAKARKLRDYWTGSVLLSWLAFEGMRWVMENLGPDHVLYPSLIDQPLINEYLKKNWKVSQEGFLSPPVDIASFPNKFLFLLPMNMVEAIACEIENHILKTWKELYGKISGTCTSMLDAFLSEGEKDFVRGMFERQNGNFWELHWAASYLAAQGDVLEIEKLLPENAYRGQFDLLERFNKIIEDKPYYQKSDHGVLYSVSHSIVQSALAVSKIRKQVKRQPETGEKCHLCGEFEVLHHKKYKGDISAGEYKENTKVFWQYLKRAWDGDNKNNLAYNLNQNEKLCSICLTKRMAYQTLKEDGDHILSTVFKGRERFPSTTDIALFSSFERDNVPSQERRKRAQKAHEKAEDKIDNHDRYFAILLMDGDNMGKLVNGETLASTWESVIHPDIIERLKTPGFEKKYYDNWHEIFKSNNKRLLTPAIHAAISESLGDFSLYGVAGIVKACHGTLIYAGGDDVCAVLPVESSLKAAREIQQYYTSTYKFVQKDAPPMGVAETWTSAPGKLAISLGKGESISISAGILICHHKESLSQMILRTHGLLDGRAKKVKGKNACAIELRKRSGGSRYFVEKWSNAEAWKSFMEIGDTIKSGNKAQVSSSLVYRLEQMREGIEAILKQRNHKEILQTFLAKQLDRSSVGDESRREAFANMMTDIVLWENSEGEVEYKPERLIVAAFMATGGEK
jgi:CRISPR-associated protein Cmr2